MLDFSTKPALVEINYRSLKNVGIIVHRRNETPKTGYSTSGKTNPIINYTISLDYMKKILLSVITLFVITATAASAQVTPTTGTPFNSGSTGTEVSQTVNINARVVAPIAFTDARNLNFGVIQAGQAPDIAASNASSAQFVFTKTAGTAVSISWTLPTELIDGSNNIPIDFSNRGSYEAGSATGTLDPSSTAVTVADFTPASEVTVNLGALITTTTSTAAGNYSATATLTVIYVGL